MTNRGRKNIEKVKVCKTSPIERNIKKFYIFDHEKNIGLTKMLNLCVIVKSDFDL